MLKNNEPCPVCKRYNNRAITVDAVIIKNNKILLIKRGVEPFKDFWALCGGYLDWNETVEDAVKREVKEELNLKVTKSKFIGVFSDPKRHPKQCVNIAFKVEVEGDPKSGDDAKEFKWFEIDELPELAFDHKKIINKILTQ